MSNAVLQESSSVLTKFGFRFGDKGTHTSRTIMVDELTRLFQECPSTATRKEYTDAIVNNNCLGKRTDSTRRLTNQRLGELYGLDISIPIFRIMRQIWDLDQNARPLLALLTSMARDPLLIDTAPPILRMRPGEELARQQMVDVLSKSTGDRLNPDSLDKVVRNTSSSWTQSGHLEGRSRKFRRRVQATPASAVFALLLAYFHGERGDGLFESQWVKPLDATKDELISLAMDARHHDLIEVKQAGGLIEVSFDRLLTDAEKKLCSQVQQERN